MATGAGARGSAGPRSEMAALRRTTLAPSGTVALLAVVILVHAVALLLIFPNMPEDIVLRGFLTESYQDAGRTLDGAVPYRDFLLEYPPGTLLFMIIPRLFAAGPLAYHTAYFVQATAFDCIVIIALCVTAQAVGLSRTRVLGLYTLGLLILGPLTIYRLDLVPAAITAIAVWAWYRDRAVLAAVLLAAGTVIKAYPAVLLPPLLIDQWLRGGLRRVELATGSFVATLVIGLSPLIWVAAAGGSTGLLHGLQFQTARHTQIESIWAMVPLVLHLAAGFPLEVVGRARAVVILGPGDTIGAASTPVLLVALAAVYWTWWKLRLHSDLRATVILAGSATVILTFAVLNRVLSPQYFLWIMPAVALLPLRPPLMRAALLSFGLTIPLTHWVYPVHYGDLVQVIDPVDVAVLTARNLLLLATLASLMVAFWKLGGTGRTTTPSP